MFKVIVRGIWAEDLFKWFYEHVLDSSGDGCGIIVCQNYQETANWFIDWFKDTYQKDFRHKPDTYGRCVNFHDNNENFIFTDDKDIHNWDGDYTFIVEDDCSFVHDIRGVSRKIYHV